MRRAASLCRSATRSNYRNTPSCRDLDVLEKGFVLIQQKDLHATNEYFSGKTLSGRMPDDGTRHQSRRAGQPWDIICLHSQSGRTGLLLGCTLHG
jgi:hypothetical protein